VISRGGKAVDLSSEHRPYGKSSISSREMARIKDAGGWIHDGRVCGILAVSRAFGDLEFKRGLEKMLVDGVLDGRWTKQFAKVRVMRLEMNSAPLRHQPYHLMDAWPSATHPSSPMAPE
jgi:hypothetical protein